MQWAAAPQQREQMVLFATRLEDVIPPDHTVRMLDLILSSPQIRWSEWETAYHGRLGQPPIHPSVLAKVLLYGLIVEATVLNVHNEDQHLFPAIEQVRQDFGLSSLPAEVLVDGLIGTGANLAKAEESGVTIYSPCEIPDPAQNPALRSDPQQPVAEADWDRLPTKTNAITINGQKVKTTQLDKSAFVYDEASDCYWCPQGKPLTYRLTTNEPSGTGQRIRRRYQAEAEVCATCPLRTRCLLGKAVARQINREQQPPTDCASGPSGERGETQLPPQNLNQHAGKRGSYHDLSSLTRRVGMGP